jgi:hypothetical protein
LEIVEITPDTRKSLTLPWEETLVMPIGDVQVGAQGVEKDRLRRHLEWGMEHGAYFLGMGDYVDPMSPSNRDAWRSIKRYDSVTRAMQDKAEEHVDEFLQITRGTEGRWLGLLHGHHYFDFEDGTTSDTRICQALEAPFLGTCAAIILRFQRGKTSLRCVIWAHHGWGGGKRQSGPINNLEDVAGWFEADVYLMGHQTKKPAVPKPRIYVSDRPPYRLVAKKKILAGTGGFYQGYLVGSKLNGLPHGTYIEEAGLPPVSLGGVVVRIRPVHSNSRNPAGRGDRLDLNCEV